jgi:hypothetical protein
MAKQINAYRVCWVGSEFYNQKEIKLKTPEFFSDKMPTLVLDGGLE